MGVASRVPAERLLALAVVLASPACSRTGLPASGPDGAQAPDATMDVAVSHPLDAMGVDSRAMPIDAGLCGNGRLDPGEECDDGNTTSGDGCSSQCMVECNWMCGCPDGPPCVMTTVCGNLWLSPVEECDDGNTSSGDGCSSSCQVEAGWRCPAPGRLCLPICGDGVTVGWETCDDGNTADGDGCASNCLVEPCWDCSRSQCVYVSCGDGGPDDGKRGICGDGLLSPGEQCDDGDLNNDQAYGGCTTQCKFGPYCGDGQVNGPEECDLGSANGKVTGKGGCNLGCTNPHYCGDGQIDPGEECDLGDLNGVPLDNNGNPSAAGRVLCDTDCRITHPVL